MIAVRLLAAAAALWLALGAAGSAAASDFADLYDDEVLDHWQPRYQEGILWNWENVIRRRLTGSERRAVADVEFAFPLRSREQEPFAYYATRPPRVTMSTLSLKFFDDLTIAYAWLWRNGYSLETALDYVAMLKYRRAAEFGGRLPAPLEAIRIPDDALEDSAVDDLAQKMFKSAVVFILLHELGHILHDHPGYGPDVSRAAARANEAEADAFALEVMRRIGALPVGMFFFFQTMAYGTPNRGDFGTDQAYDDYLATATHPVSEERMRAIAAMLTEAADDFGQEFDDPADGRAAALSIAGEIEKVADILADRDLQRLISQTARNTDLAALAPRRPGELLAAEEPTVDRATQPFDGVYDGEVTIGRERLAIRSVLRRDGDRVTGRYSYGAGAGRIDGRIHDGRLLFRWQEGGESGRGALVPKAGGAAFAGRWGYGESDSDGGIWSGRRTEQ